MKEASFLVLFLKTIRVSWQKLLEVLQPWFHEYGFCSSESPSKDTVCCCFHFVCNRICPSVNGFAVMLQNKKISVTTNKVKSRRALQTHSPSELLSNLVLFFSKQPWAQTKPLMLHISKCYCGCWSITSLKEWAQGALWVYLKKKKPQTEDSRTWFAEESSLQK